MDEERESSEHEFTEMPSTQRAGTNGGLVAVVVVLIVGLCVTVGYAYVQQKASARRASQEAAMTSTIGQLQGQIDTLNTKLNSLATAQQQPAPAPSAPAATAAATQPAQHGASATAARRRSSVENRRYKQLQGELADQQKQLKDTQDQLAQARTDLEGNISSTRDELNGSIAKTHDELVALEQKGERSYFEFDLTKSKQFQHAGPVMVSLRKADTKHKSYDVAMIIDDNQMNKKHVNLYEPIWIDGGDSQEMQLVVNKIDKDHVHGYVSAPKYNQSARLAPSATGSGSTESNSSSGTPGSSSSNSSGINQQPTQ